LPLRCHDIAGHVSPFDYGAVLEHGKTCFSWFGPIPRVTVTDPDLARDVMSNKFGHFEKPKFQAFSKLFADGVANYEGEKWVKHRRILNPAFHLEKLKVYKTVSFNLLPARLRSFLYYCVLYYCSLRSSL
jgi:cytochrome P450